MERDGERWWMDVRSRNFMPELALAITSFGFFLPRVSLSCIEGGDTPPYASLASSEHIQALTEKAGREALSSSLRPAIIGSAAPLKNSAFLQPHAHFAHGSLLPFARASMCWHHPSRASQEHLRNGRNSVVSHHHYRIAVCELLGGRQTP